MYGELIESDQAKPLTVQLEVEDVRSMLELMNDVCAAGRNLASAKGVLLEGVRRLVGADTAMAVVNRLDDVTGRAVVVSATYAHAGRSRRGKQVAGERLGRPAEDGRGERPDSAAGGIEAIAVGDANAAIRSDGVSSMTNESLRRDAGIDRCIDAPMELDGIRIVAWLTVGRGTGDARRFTPRHRAIIELLHGATRWLYAHDIILASAGAIALPPPQAEVLRRLLAGEREPQIVAALRVDSDVIRRRVQSICDHFRIADPGELAALASRTGEATDR